MMWMKFLSRCVPGCCIAVCLMLTPLFHTAFAHSVTPACTLLDGPNTYAIQAGEKANIYGNALRVPSGRLRVVVINAKNSVSSATLFLETTNGFLTNIPLQPGQTSDTTYDLHNDSVYVWLQADFFSSQPKNDYITTSFYGC